MRWVILDSRYRVCIQIWNQACDLLGNLNKLCDCRPCQRAKHRWRFQQWARTPTKTLPSEHCRRRCRRTCQRKQVSTTPRCTWWLASPTYRSAEAQQNHLHVRYIIIITQWRIEMGAEPAPPLPLSATDWRRHSRYATTVLYYGDTITSLFLQTNQTWYSGYSKWLQNE